MAGVLHRDGGGGGDDGWHLLLEAPSNLITARELSVYRSSAMH